MSYNFEYQRWRRRRNLLLYLATKDIDQSTTRKQTKSSLILTDTRPIDECRIPRIALVDPQASSWERFYVSGNTESFITLLGFDKKIFDDLVTKFEPYFYQMSSHNNRDVLMSPRTNDSRKKERSIETTRKINAKSSLALCLSYYRFKGPLYILQSWFGFTHTNVSVRIGLTMTILINILKNDKRYSINWPSNVEIDSYKHIIHKHREHLKGVYCFCNGFKLLIDKPINITLQNRYYNKWIDDYYISNLFVFAPNDGKIIFALYNAPGCIHDTTLIEWGSLYELIHETYNRTGGKCIIDSTFVTKNNNNPAIIRSSDNSTLATNPLDILVLQQATSIQNEIPEWGIKALQIGFPIITDKTIKLEHHHGGGIKRPILIECMILLYNYRIDKVGCYNQLRTLYTPALEKNVNEVLDYLY